MVDELTKTNPVTFIGRALSKEQFAEHGLPTVPYKTSLHRMFYSAYTYAQLRHLH